MLQLLQFTVYVVYILKCVTEHGDSIMEHNKTAKVVSRDLFQSTHSSFDVKDYLGHNLNMCENCSAM